METSYSHRKGNCKLMFSSHIAATGLCKLLGSKRCPSLKLYGILLRKKWQSKYYLQASQRTFTQYMSERIRHASAQSCGIHTHERKQQETGLDIVCHSVVSSSCSHCIPKFKVNVNCILPVLCKLILTTSFHQPHRYPL